MESSSRGEQPDEQQAEESVVCDFCGRVAEGARAALTWTTAAERGRVRRFCDVCSRAHLRSMEAKLDSEWW